MLSEICLQCFDGVGWAAGRASGLKTEWWGAGVVVCLLQGADNSMIINSMLVGWLVGVEFNAPLDTIIGHFGGGLHSQSLD